MITLHLVKDGKPLNTGKDLSIKVIDDETGAFCVDGADIFVQVHMAGIINIDSYKTNKE